jgi:phosphoribosylformimino-5-aminoimidazole carboxamide ribonucleotide (ProFAR) isomerase
VGGGIRNANDAARAWSSGADVVVIGNGAFENPGIIKEMSAVLQKLNSNNIVV